MIEKLCLPILSCNDDTEPLSHDVIVVFIHNIMYYACIIIYSLYCVYMYMYMYMCVCALV